MGPATEKDHEAQRFVDRDLFRDVIGHFASGVTVLTARHEGTDYGLTASAVTSLSLDPPMLLVCVSKNTGTNHAISESRAFAVNILDEDQGEIASQFARPHSDKFRGMNVSYGELGEPLLDGVLAHLECRVREEVDGGTHSVFLAEVQSADAREGTPLAYFRGRFGRFTDTADEWVYGQIRRQVLARELPLGRTLDVTELAYEIDAPRPSVYYALAKLSAEGLVSRQPESGYIITPVDAKSLTEALEARCAIEVAVADRTVGHVAEEDLVELRKRMEATLPLISDGRFVDLGRYVEANAEFHEYMVALSKNDTLLDSYRRISAETIMLRTLHGSAEASDALVEDHIRLVEAFEKGDPEAAKRVIYRHTESAKSIGQRAIESAGGQL